MALQGKEVGGTESLARWMENVRTGSCKHQGNWSVEDKNAESFFFLNHV